ncbi:hypothetical protein DFH06DRAFT_1301226 [Mycena polygramma]|nr:hypothetical protein DFH06DRAFT_1301226 [Mycena polygramma]
MEPVVRPVGGRVVILRYLEPLPQSILDASKTNDLAGPVETRLIRAHISVLRNSKYRTAEEAAAAGKRVSMLLWLVSGFRKLPNELLGEIFQWAVVGQTCVLPFSQPDVPQSMAFNISHVCRLWRGVAFKNDIWNQLQIGILTDMYARTLPQIQAVLSHGTRCKDLDIVLHQYDMLHDDGYAPALSISDVVARCSQRITRLGLLLDHTVIDIFLRLPAGTLAALTTLALTVRHTIHSGWLLSGPDEHTPLSQLAPLLSNFELNPAHHRDEHCRCTIDPLAIGFDFEKLENLKLSAGLPAHTVHAILPCCIALKKARFLIWPSLTALDSVIELPTIRELHFSFAGFSRPEGSLPQYLSLPALTRYGQQSGGERNEYELYSLLEFVASPSVRLNSLYLSNFRPLDREELCELLDVQYRLTQLRLTGCRGGFWKALNNDDAYGLAPYLTHLTCTEFPQRHVSGIITFVRNRCPCQLGSAEPPCCALKFIRLGPRFPLTDHVGRPFPGNSREHSLLLAVRHWRECGIEVKLDTEGREEFDLKQDGLATPIDSDEEDDYGQGSQWSDPESETEDETEGTTEGSPAESDVEEEDVESDS